MTEDKIQATFGKIDDKWTARIESGQHQEPKVGSQVVIVKKDGDSKNITLVHQVGTKPIGDGGSVVTFWDFFEGWSNSEETNEEPNVVELEDNEPF